MSGHRIGWVFIAAGLAAGCASGKSDISGEDGGADHLDARLITDVYTWECQDGTTGDLYEGIFGQRITLEYAPNHLSALALPSPGGCSASIDLFPISAGDHGQPIPGLDGRPRWQSASATGQMEEIGDGFYADDVFDNVHQCQDVSAVIGEGTTLTDAGDLTGLTSPNSDEIPTVSFSGLSVDAGTGAETIDFGDAVTATWSDNAWDEVWVQVRREREDTAWESVTCNATGESSFTLTDEIWGFLDPDLTVEQNNLYVAFQRSSDETLDNGDIAVGLTRAMAVAVVQD